MNVWPSAPCPPAVARLHAAGGELFECRGEMRVYWYEPDPPAEVRAALQADVGADMRAAWAYLRAAVCACGSGYVPIEGLRCARCDRKAALLRSPLAGFYRGPSVWHAVTEMGVMLCGRPSPVSPSYLIPSHATGDGAQFCRRCRRVYDERERLDQQERERRTGDNAGGPRWADRLPEDAF